MGRKASTNTRNSARIRKTLQSLAEKQALEALRLLYVGFTRARDYLVIAYKEKKLEWLESVLPEGIEALTGKGSGAIDKVRRNK